jgi:glycine cleavage system H protein
MVFILVAFTFFGLILAGAIVRHVVSKREVPTARLQLVKTISGLVEDAKRMGDIPAFWLEGGRLALSPVAATSSLRNALQFPQDVYYHYGHAWAKLDEDKRVRVGLDDFTQQVMGDIEDIEVPSIGSQLKQGETAWKLSKGKRKLSQLAPLGGTVVELNEKLIKDPSIANLSPYEKGWILKIQPKAFSEEMPELMDSFQFQVHFDRLKAKLRSSFSHQSLGMVYGDGGEVIKGVGGILEERLWKILVTQLFHSSPE